MKFIVVSLILATGFLFSLSLYVPAKEPPPDLNKCMGSGINCPCPLIATDKGWQQGSCVKEVT